MRDIFFVLPAGRSIITTVSDHFFRSFFWLPPGNLTPYPGRFELTSYLPENTQAAVVQPLGTGGAIVFGHNRVRGFTKLDQAWISLVCDKIEASIEQSGFKARGSGFGSGRRK